MMVFTLMRRKNLTLARPVWTDSPTAHRLLDLVSGHENVRLCRQTPDGSLEKRPTDSACANIWVVPRSPEGTGTESSVLHSWCCNNGRRESPEWTDSKEVG